MPIFRCTACGAVNRVAPRAAAAECSRCKRALDVSGQPQGVDAAALVSTLLSSPAPVLVDFCSEVASAGLDQLARDRAGDLLVLTVDPTEEPAAALAYGVDRVPTFILFSQGSEVQRTAQLPAEGELGSWIAAAPRREAALPRSR